MEMIFDVNSFKENVRAFLNQVFYVTRIVLFFILFVG
jgi:hypothetical protein